jgi:TonB family protein
MRRLLWAGCAFLLAACATKPEGGSAITPDDVVAKAEKSRVAAAERQRAIDRGEFDPNDPISNYAHEFHLKLDPYLKNLRGRDWPTPDGGATERRRLDVKYRVGKDGQLIGLRISRSSGIEEFDQAVLKAFKDASPFPPPPRQVLGKHFMMSVTGPSSEAGTDASPDAGERG